MAIHSWPDRGAGRRAALQFQAMTAPKITVYTKEQCPYCVRAKRLLDKKGFTYEEIDVEGDEKLRGWLVEKTGQMTVPQIFAGERSLGGYSDLDALDRAGRLEGILRGEP
jgi:glutaredoxin 3